MGGRRTTESWRRWKKNAHPSNHEGWASGFGGLRLPRVTLERAQEIDQGLLLRLR